MSVDQLSAQFKLGDRLEHGPGEEHEAFAVVLVVFAALAVELGAVIVAVLLHEIDRHAVAGQRAAEEGAGDGFPSDGDFEGDAGRFDRPAALQGLTEGGEDDHRFVAQVGQCQGQAATHVAQAAGLGEGDRFGRGNEDFHRGCWEGVEGECPSEK